LGGLLSTHPHGPPAAPTRMLRREEVRQWAEKVAAFEQYCVQTREGSEISASLAQLRVLRDSLNEVLARVAEPDDRSIVKGWLLKRKQTGKASRWKRRYWYERSRS
jgi:hypothetical protein